MECLRLQSAVERVGAKRNWASLTEAAVVFLAVMLYIWRFRMIYPSSYLVVLGYVIGSHFTHHESPGWLGFGWRRARVAFPLIFVWSVAIAAAAVMPASVFGIVRTVAPAHVLAGIGAYILWGLFQQYLLNGYFVNRLLEFRGAAGGRFVPFGAAALFAFAHFPNWFLVVVTFIGGYASAVLYLRRRSLYPLAVAHGLIGYTLYLVVPESIAAGFLIGPGYLLKMYGWYPEFLLF